MTFHRNLREKNPLGVLTRNRGTLASKLKKALSEWAAARITAERQTTASGQLKADKELNAKFRALVKELMKPDVDAKGMKDLRRLEKWTVDPVKMEKMKKLPKKVE